MRSRISINRINFFPAILAGLLLLCMAPAAPAQPITGTAREELIANARGLLFGSRKLPPGETRAEIRSRGLDRLHATAMPAVRAGELPFIYWLRVEGRTTGVFPDEPVLPPDLPNRPRVVDTAVAFRGYFGLMVDCLFGLDETAFPETPGRSAVTKDSAGYLIRFKRGWDRCETRLDADLRIVETRVTMGRMDAAIRPTFATTPQGLVVESARLESTMGASTGTMTMKARYDMVEGMPLPTNVRFAGRDMLMFSPDSVRAIAVDDTVSIGNYTFAKQ
jgi:hypothetical protein